MGRKKEFTGIWIPRDVWEDDRLGVYDKIVFSVIAGLARGETGCYATNPHLAEFCRFSERQVCKSISALTKIGYLRVENAGTPVRRIFTAVPEPRTMCGVTTHDVQGNHAPCADLPRTMCGVTTHDVQGSDENLPIILNYNNIYNNSDNNKHDNKPTLEEIKAYISEQGAAVDPVKFYKYYDAGNWLDRKGHPINWKQKVILWDSDVDKKKEQDDAVPAASSFDVDEFFAASLEASYKNNAADEDLPWVGG